MHVTQAVHVAQMAGLSYWTRAELETAKRALEDLLANIEHALSAAAPADLIPEKET